MRKFYCSILLLLIISFTLSAQEHTVTGTVTSSDDGTYLPGVTIIIKDTNIGTTTNQDGQFLIKTPNSSSTLIFSFVGYSDQTIEIADRNKIDVVLEVSAEKLDEVVVTALGIERDVKSIGYAVQKVEGKDLVIARSETAINQLAGKVTGLTLSETNGGAGSSSRVILRGNNSFTGGNQAMIVVDGMPIMNLTISNAAGTWGGQDIGNGLSDINQDDIESVTVLKGASASALYGSSAANGVILITTKKGNNRKGIGVTFNTNASLNQAYIHYDLQNIYGGGRNGKFEPPFKIKDGVPVYDVNSPSAYGSWGPKMEGQEIVDWDGNPSTYSPQPDNYKDFFKNGFTFSNNLSLFGGNRNLTYRVSIGDIRTNEIIFNSDYARTNVGLNMNVKFAKNFILQTYISYIHQKADNRFHLSDSHDNKNRNYIMMPRHISNSSMENNIMDEEGNEQTWYMNWSWMTNPYFGPKYRLDEDKKNRILGNISLTYAPNTHLSFMIRAASDYSLTKGQERHSKGGLVNSQGHYSEAQSDQFLINGDFLATYNNQVAESFFYTVNVGGNARYTSIIAYNAATIGGLVTDGDFSLENSVYPPWSVRNLYENAVTSLYAFAEFDYKHFLFLDLTGRNDWSSTLPAGNNSYFYPSVNLGFVFTELINLGSKGQKAFSFGKIRASYAEVGSSSTPYLLEPAYIIDSTSGAFGTYAQITNTIPNANMKPERVKSIEFGTDLRFFMDRLSLDFTWYKTNATNQIMRVDVSAASGSTNAMINAGNVQNDGIELQLKAEPVRAKNFIWDFIINYTKNNSRVVELASGIDNILLYEHWRLSIEARPGNPYGDIVGYAIQRDVDGGKMVDEYGMYLRDSIPRVLGNVTPDFSMSLLNNFRIGNFMLSTLIDARFGGDMFAGTNMYGYGYSGNFTETLEGREDWYASERAREEAGVSADDWTASGGYLAEGVYQPGTVIDDVDVSGQTNKTYVNPELYWDQFSNWTNEIHEPFVYDASFIKLRELILTYNFPLKMISKIKMKNASVSAYCRNVWVIYKKVPNVDPESFYVNSNGQGYELYSYPNKRSYGISISIGF